MAYADFSLRYPEKLKIVGVADPDKYRQKMVSEKFGFSEEFCFDSAEELEEVIRNVAGDVHREISEMNPIVDAHLTEQIHLLCYLRQTLGKTMVFVMV